MKITTRPCPHKKREETADSNTCSAILRVASSVSERSPQDPADRILAATAQVLDLTLVTADERLLGLGNIRTLANR
ncbi:MAG TPA: PIN domain-containing protein [Terriglobales bacterium]|nr:PIN domain-containing protein [Terriglobales bacterium]